MKKITLLLCVTFIFSACKKSAEHLPVTANNTTENAVADAASLKFKFAFSSSVQGWSVSSDGTLDYSFEDGNPGGCVIGADDADLNEFWYFVAPPKLLTGVKALNANALNFIQFDLKAPTGDTNAPDVIIQSSTLTLVLDIPIPPNDVSWTTYTVYLTNQSNWRLNSLNGKVATKFQVKKALATITGLLIRGEFVNTANLGLLDNVGYGTVM